MFSSSLFLSFSYTCKGNACDSEKHKRHKKLLRRSKIILIVKDVKIWQIATTGGILCKANIDIRDPTTKGSDDKILWKSLIMCELSKN